MMIDDYKLSKVIIVNMLRKHVLVIKWGISVQNWAQVHLVLQIHSIDVFFLNLEMICLYNEAKVTEGNI